MNVIALFQPFVDDGITDTESLNNSLFSCGLSRAWNTCECCKRILIHHDGSDRCVRLRPNRFVAENCAIAIVAKYMLLNSLIDILVVLSASRSDTRSMFTCLPRELLQIISDNIVLFFS